MAGNDLYGGSNRLLAYLQTHNNIKTHHISTTDPDNFLPLLKPNSKVRMVLLETPTNPLLQIADLASIATLVHQHIPEALIVVDNTMMTSYLQRPLEHGADIVYDSATKYLSGHHDLMAGAIICNRDDLAKVSVSPFSMAYVRCVNMDLPIAADLFRYQFNRQRSHAL